MLKPCYITYFYVRCNEPIQLISLSVTLYTKFENIVMKANNASSLLFSIKNA